MGNNKDVFRLVDGYLFGTVDIVLVNKTFQLASLHVYRAVISPYKLSAGSKSDNTLILGVGHINGFIGSNGHTFRTVKGVFLSVVIEGGYYKFHTVIGI